MVNRRGSRAKELGERKYCSRVRVHVLQCVGSLCICGTCEMVKVRTSLDTYSIYKGLCPKDLCIRAFSDERTSFWRPLESLGYICVYVYLWKEVSKSNFDLWTDAATGVGRVKEKTVRRKKMKVHEKVEKPRSTVSFQCFGAPEGWNVGSLKWRVQSHLAGWENCTRVWREAHFEVKMSKATSGPEHFWQLICSKSGRSCGTKLWHEAHLGVKMLKHLNVGALLEVEFLKVHTAAARSTCHSQNVKATSASEHFCKLSCSKSALGARRQPCSKPPAGGKSIQLWIYVLWPNFVTVITIIRHQQKFFCFLRERDIYIFSSLPSCFLSGHTVV